MEQPKSGFRPEIQKPYNLSPSSLGLFKECSRCFWLQIKKKYKRPDGIYPSLPAGMDLVIKSYFDEFRGKMPRQLSEAGVKGVLFEDQTLVNRWRNWRTSLRVRTESYTLSGALDDVLVEDDYFMPFDFKTRGFAPNEGTADYYQHQMDAYGLMLDKNGYPTEGDAYLLFFHPKRLRNLGSFDFEPTPKRISIDPSRTEKLLDRAVDCLESPAPRFKDDCNYCGYIKPYIEGYVNKQKAKLASEA